MFAFVLQYNMDAHCMRICASTQTHGDVLAQIYKVVTSGQSGTIFLELTVKTKGFCPIPYLVDSIEQLKKRKT